MVSLLLQQRDKRGSGGGGGHDDDVVACDVCVGPSKTPEKGGTDGGQTDKYNTIVLPTICTLSMMKKNLIDVHGCHCLFLLMQVEVSFTRVAPIHHVQLVLGVMGSVALKTPQLGAALENFPARKRKKKFWFHVGKILRTKLSEQAEPHPIPPAPPLYRRNQQTTSP
jgi:hypothetical protein